MKEYDSLSSIAEDEVNWQVNTYQAFSLMYALAVSLCRQLFRRQFLRRMPIGESIWGIRTYVNRAGAS